MESVSSPAAHRFFVFCYLSNFLVDIPCFAYLDFGYALGGFCTFAAEDTGVRCTPSGFFFNFENQIELELLGMGVIDAILSMDDTGSVEQDAFPTSIGIFQDADGEVEAVVFRFHLPVSSLFGVSAGASPFVHFQSVKGSEIYRRQQTLLRKAYRNSTADEWGVWIPVSFSFFVPLLFCTFFASSLFARASLNFSFGLLRDVSELRRC